MDASLGAALRVHQGCISGSVEAPSIPVGLVVKNLADAPGTEPMDRDQPSRL